MTTFLSLQKTFLMPDDTELNPDPQQTNRSQTLIHST